MVKAMLATEAPVDQLDDVVNDPEWALEQKLDGERLLVDYDGRTLRFCNRNGLPKFGDLTALRSAFDAVTDEVPFILDGELLDGVLYLFDVCRFGDFCTVDQPHVLRRSILERIAVHWGSDVVRLLPSVSSPTAKAELVQRVREMGGEGLVAKRHDGRYEPGVRSRSMLKYKFVSELDAVVYAVRDDGKESCALALHDGTGWVSVGRCSINGKPIPEIGSVVQVRYLYCTDPYNPRLYQPRLIRIRDDKDAHDCGLDQVRFTDRTVVTLT